MGGFNCTSYIVVKSIKGKVLRCTRLSLSCGCLCLILFVKETVNLMNLYFTYKSLSINKILVHA